MELHFVLWIIKSVQLRISTDSSSTTNLDVYIVLAYPYFCFHACAGISQSHPALCLPKYPFKLPRD